MCHNNKIILQGDFTTLLSSVGPTEATCPSSEPHKPWCAEEAPGHMRFPIHFNGSWCKRNRARPGQLAFPSWLKQKQTSQFETPPWLSFQFSSSQDCWLYYQSLSSSFFRLQTPGVSPPNPFSFSVLKHTHTHPTRRGIVLPCSFKYKNVQVWDCYTFWHLQQHWGFVPCVYQIKSFGELMEPCFPVSFNLKILHFWQGKRMAYWTSGSKGILNRPNIGLKPGSGTVPPFIRFR